MLSVLGDAVSVLVFTADLHLVIFPLNLITAQALLFHVEHVLFLEKSLPKNQALLVQHRNRFSRAHISAAVQKHIPPLEPVHRIRRDTCPQLAPLVADVSTEDDLIAPTRTCY